MNETPLAVRPIRRDDYPGIMFTPFNPRTDQLYPADIAEATVRTINELIEKYESNSEQLNAIKGGYGGCRFEIMPNGGLFRISLLPEEGGEYRVNLILSRQSIEF